MKKIRKKVFESNSSSCHSLQISTKGLQPSQFKLDEKDYIHCDYGQFGDCRIYSTQYDKLSYLLTHAFYNTSFLDYRSEEIYEKIDFKLIEDAVKSYIPNCKGIKIDMECEPELNHQLYEEEIVNIWNEKEVTNFIFNDFIELKIYRD